MEGSQLMWTDEGRAEDSQWEKRKPLAVTQLCH
jgi:hypothetical protein